MAQTIQPLSIQIGLDWLCYLAGNSQTASTIFFSNFQEMYLNHFIKNPQTTIVLIFLTYIGYIISATGGGFLKIGR